MAQTAFTPVKLEVHNGRIYVRTSEGKILLYGAADNATYDDCVATGETPWLSARTPATNKQQNAVDTATEGAWTIQASSDPSTGILKNVYNRNGASFWLQSIPVTTLGQFVKFKFFTTGETYARIGSLVSHFEAQESD